MASSRHSPGNVGFTLIEIIAVLAIIGILAAVAVPKFFDLQTRSREKAIFTAVSELNERVKQHFADQLLQGRTTGAITYSSAEVDLNLGPDFLITRWAIATSQISLSVKYPGHETNASLFTIYDRTIRLPQVE